MFILGEKVYTGNSIDTAPSVGTVNFNADGLLQFINVIGTMFAPGDLVFGQDSGYSARITAIDETVDIITGQPWDQDFVTQDDGSVIALDAFFTGANSQNYQTDNVVVTG